MVDANIEIADVFRTFQVEYNEMYGDVMLPSHKRAIADITACMTESMGGSRYKCNDCNDSFWAYHGCRNRSCPKCHGRQTVEWLKSRDVNMLPCEYFHVVATVPSELRALFLKEQKNMYGLFMKTVAEALKAMACDPRYLGAEPGILAVLHTWTSRMNHHPHVHLLVTGGGVSSDGKNWLETKGGFLVPVKKLSPAISSLFAEKLKRKHPDIFNKIPENVWKKEWCSFIKHFGKGQDAVLKYLSRYVFRIAITSNRIESISGDYVAYRYKENNTGIWKREKIKGTDFIRRYLLHVLPKGFHKVRYYGMWSPGKRHLQEKARYVLTLELMASNKIVDRSDDEVIETALAESELESHNFIPICPKCKSENVTLIESRKRKRWRKMFEPM